jgi:uncharacterized protein (DUF1499 family)
MQPDEVRMVQHTNRSKLTPYITFHRIITSIIWINALVVAVVVAFDPTTSISSFSSRRRPIPDATTAIVGATAGSDTSTVSSDISINNIDDDDDNNNNNSKSNSVSRRKLFTGISTATTAALQLSPLLLLFSSSPPPVHAFTNAIPEAKKYGDRPKRKGTAPKDLGVLPRTTEGIDTSITSPRLRTCDGNPNCFSTTGDLLLEDRQMYGVDFLIPEWIPPTNKDDESSRKLNSIDTIASVMQTYEPGQGGIDGGGFTVIKRTDSYLYYQFEALKKGYIDDVEFALIDSKNTAGGIQVRSASRVGVTDFGVNAIRLNYIAKQLQTKYGWSIPEITSDTHRDYWITATEAQEATFDEDRRNY